MHGASLPFSSTLLSLVPDVRISLLKRAHITIYNSSRGRARTTISKISSRDCDDAKIRSDSTDAPRGYGIVSFTSAEDAQKAISAVNGSDCDGRTVNVRFDRAKCPNDVSLLRIVVVVLLCVCVCCCVG